MRASTASPGPRTVISTSTRDGTSSGRSSSRSTRRRCCAASWGEPSWKREHVALGTNTDPYQWVEGRYRLMRGDLGGAARRGEPLLDPHEVAAAAARPRAADGDREAHRRQRQPLGPDARREGVAGERAAHAQPARAAGGGGGAQPGGHPHWHPDRAADAWDQRRPGAGRADPRAGARRRARQTSAGSRCTCGGRCGGIFMDWLRSTGRTWWSATRSSTARGAYLPP